MAAVISRQLNRVLMRLPFGGLSASVSSDERLSKFSYWQTLYKESDPSSSFDWFLDSEQILDPVLYHIDQVYKDTQDGDKNDLFNHLPLHILDLGCGTSDLALNIFMHNKTTVSITLIDFVLEALEKQRPKFTEHPPQATGSLFYTVCANVMKLPFCDSSFHFQLDKGTMDALMKDKLDGPAKAQQMMSEVLRVLAPGGRFLQISDEDPDIRLQWLENICRKCFKEVSDNSEYQTTISPRNYLPDTPLLHTSIQNRNDNAYFELQTDESVYEKYKKYEMCFHSEEDQYQAEDQDSVKEQVNKTEPGKSYTRPPTLDDSNAFSQWSFKIISPSWGREYFLYWKSKLKM